jgi:large subunit ribosomal protein L4
VIFEGDAARRGTASTKWRSEVHGSSRKIRPQKGSGRARLGDKKSPMLRGGGVAHGPKPRDFSTELPRKLYDQAWRGALSYRYRRGELLVVDSLWGPNIADMVNSEGLNAQTVIEGMDGVVQDTRDAKLAGLTQVFRDLEGQEEQPDGTVRVKRVVWITGHGEDHPDLKHIRRAMSFFWPEDKVKTADKVDVKNLLELERIVIEKSALDTILEKHQSDLRQPIDIVAARQQVALDAEAMRQAVEQVKKEAKGEAITFALEKVVAEAYSESEAVVEQARRRVDKHFNKQQQKPS